MTTVSWGKRATSSAAPRSSSRARSAALAASLACAALAGPAAFLAACGGKPAASAESPAGASTVSLHAPVDFDFDSLDERPVSAQATRGKPTVLTFVTTGSLPAQAQVDYLVAMAKNDGDKVNYAVVALEGNESRELVELYRKALNIPFPVAMADAQTLGGAGPFGDVSAVPVTVMLDRLGRPVWRVDGRVAKSEELRKALRGL